MAENVENNGCSQRDNAEHEGYAKASRSFNRIWKERDSGWRGRNVWYLGRSVRYALKEVTIA